MKKSAFFSILLLLTACKSGPGLEDDVRYVKFARVVEVHVYTDTERKEAKTQLPGNVRVGGGFSVGFGSGSGSFGGMMLGMGTTLGDERDENEPPKVAYGANRFTVVTVGKAERFELNSYGKFKVGDCVKVLMGHPSEYARLFELKPGEHCE